MDAAKEFAHYGVATIYQAAGYSGLIDVDLIQVVPGTRVAGPARTVECAQDDNLMVHAAMERLKPGDVMVITMPRAAPIALLGDLLATQAARHGAAAILVNGAVRDSADLARLGLPIWARWIRVAQAAKEVTGQLDVPVEIGGATIQPGDFIVLDSDGAVVVAAGRAATVLRSAAALSEVERQRRAAYQAGELSLDLMGLRQRLK